jgi:hypothetical protein
MNKQDLHIHDLIFVNPYGPFTYNYNDMPSDTAYRPKIYNFDLEDQYEIIFVGADYVGLFDNDNCYHEISIDRVSKIKFEYELDPSKQIKK